MRLAEDISVVDTLSGGRRLGVGSGYGPVEYAAFGADFDDKRKLTTDRLAIVRQALANQEVGTSGFDIEPPGATSPAVLAGSLQRRGRAYAAAAGSNLLLNRATYGYAEPTDLVQRPWAEEFLAKWSQPHRPRIGLSRFIFPAGTSGLRWPRSRRACSGGRRVSFSAASSRPG